MPKGTKVTCNDINSITANITFHLQNPGTGSSSSLSTVRAENGVIINDYEVATGEFSENNIRWFRFYTTSGTIFNQVTTYYTASARVQAICNGEELIFTKIN